MFEEQAMNVPFDGEMVEIRVSDVACAAAAVAGLLAVLCSLL